jgi:hypothetical protein
MSTNTKKTVVLAVLAAATGMVALDLGSVASAETMTRAQAYAQARIDTAFDAVALLPETAFTLPMAVKGDLQIPQTCLASAGRSDEDCFDIAYELFTTPSIILESREGTTTILTRMDGMTLAGMPEEPLLQSE